MRAGHPEFDWRYLQTLSYTISQRRSDTSPIRVLFLFFFCFFLFFFYQIHHPLFPSHPTQIVLSSTPFCVWCTFLSPTSLLLKHSPSKPPCLWIHLFYVAFHSECHQFSAFLSPPSPPRSHPPSAPLLSPLCTLSSPSSPRPPSPLPYLLLLPPFPLFSEMC